MFTLYVMSNNRMCGMCILLLLVTSKVMFCQLTWT